MSNYSVENLLDDFAKLLPAIKSNQSLATLEPGNEKRQPEDIVAEARAYFVEKYGKKKGLDYVLRFFSVFQFLQHNQKVLVKDGLIKDNDQDSLPLHYLIDLLLRSFKPPQPPSPFPSSNLYNQYRKFNYKKVLKAYKSENLKLTDLSS